MRTLVNPGGSLTVSALVVAVAWVVRTIRSARLKQQQQRNASLPVTYESFGKFYAPISFTALRILIATQPIPHYVFDLRTPEESEEYPLPSGLGSVIPLQVHQLPAALTDPEAWQEAAAAATAAAAGAGLGPAGGAGSSSSISSSGSSDLGPTPNHLLVFLAPSEELAQQAAGLAASLGFQRTAILPGGLLPPPISRQHHLPVIQRDALAALLGRLPLPPGLLLPPTVLLDVRRYDERTLYGGISGSCHIPVDELASGLSLPPDEFRCRYHHAKPEVGEVLVMQSRTSTRALWAAVIAIEAGYNRVFVYKQGTYGWKFERGVKAYPSYQVWEVPPDPEGSTLEEPNPSRAVAELDTLGLISR